MLVSWSSRKWEATVKTTPVSREPHALLLVAQAPSMFGPTKQDPSLKKTPAQEIPALPHNGVVVLPAWIVHFTCGSFLPNIDSNILYS